MKKKIFLAFAYSQKNAGDLAITVGALDLLRKIGDYEITVLSRYDENSREYKQSEVYYQQRYKGTIKVIPSPFVLDRQHGLIKSLYFHLHGLLLITGLVSSREIYSEIESSDFVVFNGGNLLRCSRILDFLRLKALNYPLELARRLKKRYYIFPQSSAEIKQYGEGVIYRMLSGAEKAFIRERLSYESLNSRFKLGNLIQTIDLAFFIDNERVDGSSNRDKQSKIAFTFRAHTVGDISEFGDNEKKRISDYIVNFVSKMRSTDEVLFVVQTRKDLEFTTHLQKQVFTLTSREATIIENYDPVNLISLYSSVDLLVGMRLHSIILAISVGTPCFGLFYSQWGLKNPGIMERFGLPYRMLDNMVASMDLHTEIQDDFSSCENLINNKAEFREFSHNIIRDEFHKFETALTH